MGRQLPFLWLILASAALATPSSAGAGPFAGADFPGVEYLSISIQPQTGRWREDKTPGHIDETEKDLPTPRASDVMLHTVKVVAMMRGQKLDKNSVRSLAAKVADAWKKFPVERISVVQVYLVTEAWDKSPQFVHSRTLPENVAMAYYWESRPFGPSADEMHVVPAGPWEVKDGAWKPEFITPETASPRRGEPLK